MMTIALTPDLEQAVAERARALGTTVEQVILETLAEKFLPLASLMDTTDTLSEWELEITVAAEQVEAVTAETRK